MSVSRWLSAGGPESHRQSDRIDGAYNVLLIGAGLKLREDQGWCSVVIAYEAVSSSILAGPRHPCHGLAC